MLAALALTGCAGSGSSDCGPDWRSVGQRDGRMNAGSQAANYAARCVAAADGAVRGRLPRRLRPASAAELVARSLCAAESAEMALMRPAYGWLMVPLLAASPRAPRNGTSLAPPRRRWTRTQKCRVEARLSPQTRPAGPNQMTSADPLVDRGQERDAQEAQEVRKCMEGKGYRSRADGSGRPRSRDQ